jgi:hypothetical protein
MDFIFFYFLQQHSRVVGLSSTKQATSGGPSKPYELYTRMYVPERQLKLPDRDTEAQLVPIISNLGIIWSPWRYEYRGLEIAMPLVFS